MKSNTKKSKIIVAGDIMLDIYSFGDASRISPEAPVPVLKEKPDMLKLVPGGAANVAMNLLATGVSEVAVFAMTGLDDEGRQLKGILDDAGVDTSYIYEHQSRPTTVKHRFIAQNNQQIMRVDYEDSSPVPVELLTGCFEKIEKNIKSYDVIVLSDYDKGFLNKAVAQKIIKLAKRHNIPVLADVKGIHYDRYMGATLLKPNKSEAKTLTGLSVITTEDAVKASAELCKLTKSEYVLTTLGADGMILVNDNELLLQISSVAREVYDVTGAGDTSIAYLAAMLGAGKDIMEAVRIANYAAGVQVSKVGTSVVYPHEVKALMYGRTLGYDNKELNFYKENGLIRLEQTRDNKKIVFTNGCFDILHAGHIDYLRKAKTLGDCLVIGVNSDASVKRLKGKSRPINSLSDRLVLLSALEFVDYLIPFEEDTPDDLIRAVKPDILVKGGDYRTEDIVGAEFVQSYGGCVTTIPFLDGRSTTGIIEKIKG